MNTVNVEFNHKPNKDNLYSVFIRLTIEGADPKREMVKGVYVAKRDMNKKARRENWIRESCTNFEVYNNEIKKLVDQYKKMYSAGIDLVGRQYFFDFAYEYIKQYKNPKQVGTHDLYSGKLGKLKQYIGPGWDKFKFSDVTVAFIRKYEAHFKVHGKSQGGKGKKGNKINTIRTDLSKIRAIMNQAVKEDLILQDKNPFKKIKLKKERSKKNWLTASEISLFRKPKHELTGFEEEARDVFLLCVNLWGMRIGDALIKRPMDFNPEMLHYEMGKSNKHKNIKLTKEASKIVAKYSKGKEPDRYLFSFVQPHKDEFELHDKISAGVTRVNRHLKEVADKAGIKKHITSHVARHTFAQLAMDNDVNWLLIQKMLDHEKFETTQEYLSGFSDNKADAANALIFGEDV